jgi:hypothetical protein
MDPVTPDASAPAVSPLRELVSAATLEAPEDEAFVDVPIDTTVPLSEAEQSAASVGVRTPGLALVGATPSPAAKLRPPVAVRAADEPAFRRALADALTDAVATTTRACDDDARPPISTAQIESAATAAPIAAVRGRAGPRAFALVVDETVTAGCNGEPGEVLAFLLDPEGAPDETWSANAGITLEWLVDLDGDGVDELVLHHWWLEDGMEEVHLLFDAGDGWETRKLFISDSP